MIDAVIRIALRLLVGASVSLAACVPAAASHLVTGNGFGFAVVAPESGSATKFYPHPYSFLRPDPAKPLSEGIETPNFIKKLSWAAAGAARVDYVDDSHVISMQRAGATGTFFMPFGFDHPALIIDLKARTPEAATWRVDGTGHWSARP